MPRMLIVLPHTLGAMEALARMKQFVTRLSAQYARHISHAEQHWEGNVGRFKLHLMGFAVDAVVTVGETDVRMEGTMPWAAALFRGRIEETIRREVAALLK